MYLFFDTETTGLPKNYNGKVTDLDNWPRIIQLAFVFTDENFNIQHEYCELIKPNGWVIPNQKFWIDNGFNTETNVMYGRPIEESLSNFIMFIEKSKFLVAHNMKYDLPITAAEMIRANLSTKHKTDKICTMLSTVNYCSLPKNKWPRLDELHNKIFGIGFEDAHDALADVRATIRCFKYLNENKIINEWVKI